LRRATVTRPNASKWLPDDRLVLDVVTVADKRVCLRWTDGALVWFLRATGAPDATRGGKGGGARVSSARGTAHVRSRAPAWSGWRLDWKSWNSVYAED